MIDALSMPKTPIQYLIKLLLFGIKFADWLEILRIPIMQKNIFITGGCGYKGSKIVPLLLNLGHSVTVFDTIWFGNFLCKHPNLKILKGDIRNFSGISLEGFDTVIHLASIANDPSGDLDPTQTWEISVLATKQFAEKAAGAKVKNFIYASSGSVYGLSDAPKVTETEELVPISTYNKTKMCAERILQSYGDKFNLVIIRPATVCGLSPRMRLDVAVNMLTTQALENNKITVLGGEQVRPNIHIDDLANLYAFFVANENKLNGVFNAGFENLKIIDIANTVSKKTGAEIIIETSNDPRSYRLCSDKLLSVGFKPKKTVADAISEICDAWKSKQLKNEPQWHTVSWMQNNNLSPENKKNEYKLSA